MHWFWSGTPWFMVWDTLVYGLSAQPQVLVTPVDASTSWGDGAHCKLWPVKPNPRLDFSKSHSWCLFPRDLLRASGTCLTSALPRWRGGGEKRVGVLLVKCKLLRRTEEWSPWLCLQVCKFPLKLRWLQGDESLGTPKLMSPGHCPKNPSLSCMREEYPSPRAMLNIFKQQRNCFTSWQKDGAVLKSSNGRENFMVKGWSALFADITEREFFRVLP